MQRACRSGDIPESQFPANGVLLDVDDVSETAAAATGFEACVGSGIPTGKEGCGTGEVAGVK